MRSAKLEFRGEGLHQGGFDLFKRTTLIGVLMLSVIAVSVGAAGELVRLVRLKISAGDLASAVAAVEDYKKQTGVDAEYLDALGWLARGAEMMNKRDQAATFVAELRREIPQEKAELLAPFGAAIEVQGKLLAAGEGRASAVRFLEAEFSRAKDIGLRSRIMCIANSRSRTSRVNRSTAAWTTRARSSGA